MRKQIERGAAVVGALLLSLLLMGVKGCSSEEECKAAKLVQAQVCVSESLATPACIAATEAVRRVCGEGPGPGPTPEPTPTPTPTPLPTPTPTPPICAIPDVGATLVSPRPPAEFSDALNSVMVSLTACEVGSRCVVNASLDVFLNQVVAALRSRGICAGRQEGSTADEVCIGSSMRCQGYHAYTCSVDCNKGTVGWAPGSVRDTWVEPGTPAPPPPGPTPTPKPDGIPALSKIIVKSVGAGRPVADASPKTCPPEAERIWCTTHSTGGACCPGGGEDDPAGRQAVEAAWGPYTWSIDGRDCIASDECSLDGGNPLRVVVPGGWGKTVRVTGGNGVFGEVRLP